MAYVLSGPRPRTPRVNRTLGISASTAGATAGTAILGPGAGTAVGSIVGGLFGGSHNSYPGGNPSNMAHMQALVSNPTPANVAYLRGIAAGANLASGSGTAWPWNSGSVNWGDPSPAKGRAAEQRYAAQLVQALNVAVPGVPGAGAAIASVIQPDTTVAGAVNASLSQRVQDALRTAVTQGLVDPNDVAAVRRYALSVADKAGTVIAPAQGSRMGAEVGAALGSVPWYVWAGTAGILGVGLMTRKARR